MAKGNTWFLNIRAKGVEKTTNDVKKLKNNMGDLGSTVRKLAVGLGAVYLGKSLLSAAKGAIDTAAQFETLQLRLENMYGSAEKGKKVFDDFAKIAATTPFELANVVEAGAALKAFGSNAEETLKPVADLAAFMGTDVVDAANAVGRAFAGGAGAADVLRDRGILQLIKDSQGIVDLSSLTLPQFRKAMFDTLADPRMGIVGATNKLSKTFSGMVSNLKDNIEMMKAAIGEKFIEDLKPIIASINQELSEMGNIGWDFVGQAFINNWKEIFKQLAGIFFESGLFLGKALVQGFGIGIDDITLQMSELNKKVFENVPLWNKIFADNNEKFIAKVDYDNQKLVTDYKKKIQEIKVDFSTLFDNIKQEARQLAQDAVVKPIQIQNPFFGVSPTLGPESPFDAPVLEESGQEYISVLEAQQQKISNSLNSQVEELIAYGVSQSEAEAWKNEQLLLEMQKFEDLKEQMRLDSLEKNIEAQDADALEFEQFKIGLEKKTKALRDAGVADAKIEEWKSKEIAKWQKKDLQSRLQIGSQLVGALAGLNDQMKGSAKVTARMQQIQAVINAYAAANAAIAPPPVGLGPTPLGFAAGATALISGLANVVAISQSIGDFAKGGDFVTQGEQIIRVGDNPGGRERVQITPLSSPNINGPKGSDIVVNISGNVMSENYTEDVIIPHIQDAIRRGETL